MTVQITVPLMYYSLKFHLKRYINETDALKYLPKFGDCFEIFNLQIKKQLQEPLLLDIHDFSTNFVSAAESERGCLISRRLSIPN